MVDDHPAFRLGLSRLLERNADFEVVWSAASVQQALRNFERSPVDLVIMDLQFGDGVNGLDGLKILRKRWPDTRVLMVSAFADQQTVAAARAAVVAGAVRLLLADDQALFRTGLARLLDEDPRVHVVAEAANGQEAIAKANELRPDVIVMDVRMPNMDGIEAMQRIAATQPGIKVLFLSSFETTGSVLHALKNGASGYVLKDSMPEAIIASILAVDSGEQALSRAVADRVVELAVGGGPPKERFDGLTPRELEILKQVATGLSNKQIAYRLKISEKTVRNHVSHIYEKIGVVDRSQAAVYAVRKGLIEL